MSALTRLAAELYGLYEGRRKDRDDYGRGLAAAYYAAWKRVEAAALQEHDGPGLVGKERES